MKTEGRAGRALPDEACQAPVQAACLPGQVTLLWGPPFGDGEDPGRRNGPLPRSLHPEFSSHPRVCVLSPGALPLDGHGRLALSTETPPFHGRSHLSSTTRLDGRGGGSRYIMGSGNVRSCHRVLRRGYATAATLRKGTAALKDPSGAACDPVHGPIHTN